MVLSSDDALRKGFNKKITKPTTPYVANKQFRGYDGRIVTAKLGGRISETPSIGRRSGYLQLHGCTGCIWVETKHCPHSKIHGGQVSEFRSHANKICQEKVNFIEDMRDELNDGKGLSHVKERLFKEVCDNAWIANHKTRQALQNDEGEDGELYWKDSLDWKKFLSDIMLRWLKHNEGSKVIVEKTVNPMDVAKMIEVVDIKEGEK